ncbi:YlaI family protein [Staphylococcus caprae]|nr:MULTISPECIES: YlaI family protein [Staphylococcus]MBU5271333.1 YlaI family protein [Staphylococcus caprae]MDK6297030.1 YlaI family protein [Staphylococcus caprae]MDK7232818.1 YlaI family protein [Staphylococcus caprae]POA04292.1 DUF2197 domain-containing protein [Staphylococcus caprae]RIM35218.1 DUF2197 domain-containing protein [Staphylococcus caprae]
MLEVQCIICETKVFIDENTLEAKRLRNNPIRTFMCDDCKSRLDTPKQRQPQVINENPQKQDSNSQNNNES